MDVPLTPELLIRAYQVGVFPMSEGREDPEVFWVDPKRRGVFPLDAFHISRSLARNIKNTNYRVEINTDFAGVVAGCAARDETWISTRIAGLYQALHEAELAHSQEIWMDDRLIGGVYGVTIGGAFFGESMFSAETNGSKLALAYLIHRLRAGGFILFDTQFLTPHLASLGAIEVTRATYHKSLQKALALTADFTTPETPRPEALLASQAQRNTQTS